MKREDFFDTFACERTAKKLCRERLGHEETICGICVSVCPLGRKKRTG
jgi:epoxyqueuosine reductase QueG